MPELTYRTAQAEDIPVIFSLSKDLIDRYEDLSSIDYEKVMAWMDEAAAIYAMWATGSGLCSRCLTRSPFLRS